jgi:hypothetical protein
LVRAGTGLRGPGLVVILNCGGGWMPSGGARARSGPPADPNALSRDRKSDVGFTVLPASGRVGDPPEWPLTEASPREVVLWAAFWAKPQAILWELNGQAFEVAMHVRKREASPVAAPASSSRSRLRAVAGGDAVD